MVAVFVNKPFTAEVICNRLHGAAARSPWVLNIPS
jgi:hypothetical protein